jgi:hypothetical protein
MGGSFGDVGLDVLSLVASLSGTASARSPCVPVVANPIEQGGFQSNVASRSLGLQPLMLQNLFSFGEKFLIEALPFLKLIGAYAQSPRYRSHALPLDHGIAYSFLLELICVSFFTQVSILRFGESRVPVNQGASMFKRVQLKHSSKISLDFAVMEDVQKELVAGQSLQERPLIKAVQKLSRKELGQLRYFCIADEGAELQQIVTIDNVLLENDNLTLEQIQETQSYFEELGLIVAEGSLVRFAGDALDKIYTEYLAREQRVNMPFLVAPPEFYLAVTLRRKLDVIEGVSVFSSRRFPLRGRKSAPTVAFRTLAEPQSCNLHSCWRSQPLYKDPCIPLPSCTSIFQKLAQY